MMMAVQFANRSSQIFSAVEMKPTEIQEDLVL